MRELAIAPGFDGFRNNVIGHLLSSVKRGQTVENTEDDRNAYDASQAAYGSEEHHKKLLDRGYVRDDALSTDNTKVYSSEKHAIVSYRGTVHDNRDYSADLAIAAGTHRSNESFKDAEKLARAVQLKYQKPILYTGHSLGGTKAVESSRALGGKSIVFNPGSSYRHPLDTSHSVIHRTNQDYISYNTRGGQRYVYRGGHSLSNFRFLE